MAKRKRSSSRQGSFSNTKRARLNKSSGIISLLKYVGDLIFRFIVELSNYITAHVSLSKMLFHLCPGSLFLTVGCAKHESDCREDLPVVSQV